MSSFSIGSLVHWLTDMVSKSVISYSLGSTVLLLGSILYGCWSPSTPWGHYGDTHQLSWQEPFSYEAKVYAALSPGNPINVSSSFFETAQLLWHIHPQSIENRYPLLRHKAVVNISSLLWPSSDLDQRLYAYMFIQEVGQFGPHPNLSDPELIPELQYVSGASWAIVLENHAYPCHGTPNHVQRTSTPLLAGFYNPPLLRNDFTKSRPKIQLLATLKDKGLAADAYPPTIDVEFELAGIKQGWGLARAHLDGHTQPTAKTVHVEKLIPAPWDPTEIMEFRSTTVVCSDGLIPLDAVRRLSVPLVLVFVLSRALIVVSLPMMALMLLHHDSMSASRWTGVSRTTIATMYLGAIVGVTMDNMPFSPLAGLSWLVHNLFWRKLSPITTNQSPAQEQITVATDKAVPDSAIPEVAPLSHSNLVDPVVAIRRSVDEVAMYWLNLLTIPAIVTAAVYHTLLRQEYSLSSLGVPKDLLIGCIRIVKSVVWLPQILVNYKAKSGSLVPVAFIIPTLVYSVASAIFYHLSGHTMFGEIAAYSFPVYLGYVILLLQWIMYPKVKQD
ncbi:hypothetical protein GGI17_003233 [Coemansia sp. S146]|nr:hypothetical protein GGI17_003233 [Coemansia sp. S146]